MRQECGAFLTWAWRELGRTRGSGWHALSSSFVTKEAPGGCFLTTGTFRMEGGEQTLLAEEVSQWSVSGLKSSHWKTLTVQLSIFPEDNSEITRHQLFVLLTLSPCPCKYHAPSQRRFYLVCIQLLLLFPTSFTVLHTYLLYS